MRLILDPAEDAAHGEWLRGTPGAYEWWYFDAVSDNGEWALACIWFLGNPFSPYYRLAAIGQPGDPFTHNALFFALYRRGRLHAYHFTIFPPSEISADEDRPATLRFGENTLRSGMDGAYRLQLADENANRRRMEADLRFRSVPLRVQAAQDDSGRDTHFWLPAAPACRVEARITLREKLNAGAERITFSGHGYHDHNRGRLPFDSDIRDWYWARAALGVGRAVVVYQVNTRTNPISHLLLFEDGRLVHQDANARVKLERYRLNGFGTRYATRLNINSKRINVVVRLEKRLDSSPFYLRTLCAAEISISGERQTGTGVGEYFRPHSLASRLTASATKARIVER